jgi:hypothetical protein
MLKSSFVLSFIAFVEAGLTGKGKHAFEWNEPTVRLMAGQHRICTPGSRFDNFKG